MGLYLSWKIDLPSGPAVISFYGLALVIGGTAVYFWHAENRLRALRTILIGAGGTVVVVLGFWGGGRWLGGSSISVSDEARRIETNLSQDHTATHTKEELTLKNRKQSIVSRTGRCVGPNKIDRYLSLVGPEERLQLARVKLSENARRGLEFLLIALADDELPLLYREEGAEMLEASFKDTFGYDPQVEVTDNDKALLRICDHIRAIKRSGGAGKGAGS